MTTEEFIQQTFGSSSESSLKVQQAKLWLDAEQKKEIEQILRHKYPSLRVRYWIKGGRTAWILDEIGKEHPITFGVAVENGRIIDVQVLEFRESRGGEIRYSFFTKQFLQAALDPQKNKPTLTNSIDGITGATLSVRAAKKIATMALFFHQQIEKDGDLNEILSAANLRPTGASAETLRSESP